MEPTPPPRTHLSRLPEDTLRKIWGIAFDTPRTSREDDKVLISRLSLMTSEISPFSSFAGDHVNTLTLDANENATGGLNAVLLNAAVAEHGPGFPEQAIHQCTGVFTKLEVYTVLHYSLTEARIFADLLANHCPSVRVLDLAWLKQCRPWRVTVDKLIELLGGQLDALGVNCLGNPDDYNLDSPSSDDSIQSDSADIAEREFRKYAVERIITSCPRLKTFSFSGSNMSCLDSLWPHLGPTLEEVNLDGQSLYPSWAPTIDNMEEHCRKLTSISIVGDAPDNEQFASFLSTYSGQLKEVNLGDLECGLCELVIQSCPNLRCTVLESGDDLFRLRSLGRHLHDLELTVADEVDMDLIADISKNCTHITKLMVESDSVVDPIPFLFAGEKRQLIYLELNCKNVLDEDSLDKIAKMTGALKTLTIREVPIRTFHEFDMIASMNPNLEEVRILPTPTYEIAIFAHIRLVGVATGIAESFAKCRELESIEIRGEEGYDSSTISRMSVMAKPFLNYSLRGIKVNLFGATLRPFVTY